MASRFRRHGQCAGFPARSGLAERSTAAHKIKRLDPVTAECRSWLGHGAPGLEDGDADATRFGEPSGLAVAAGHLYIADTNNHAVRLADLATGAV
jgi:NHL repeat